MENNDASGLQGKIVQQKIIKEHVAFGARVGVAIYWLASQERPNFQEIVAHVRIGEDAYPRYAETEQSASSTTYCLIGQAILDKRPRRDPLK